MKFSAPINVHAATDEQLKALQPGQWVYATDQDAKGQFLGIKPSGSIVVAWLSNTRSHQDKAGYRRALRDYALAR